MVKTLTAYTMEIDDVQAAVAEIKEQLDLDTHLRQNAVGLVSCYSEFVESGVVAALSEALPFDILGSTTIGTGTKDVSGQLMLTLTVLTSDDVRFATGVTGSLLDMHDAQLANAYGTAAETLGEKPVMMIGFMALLQQVGGDVIIDALDKVTGGVPIFGTVTVDHTADYSTAQVLYKDKAYSDAFAFVLLAGEVHPSFIVASINPENIRKQQAIITDAEGNLLNKVNDMPVLDYMQTLGLAKNGQIEGMNAIPFIIDYNDGTTPIARAIFAITPDGSAVCGGVMPEGATLSVGSIDYDDVIDTTAGMMESIAGRKDAPNGLLLYSCISRYLSLGVASDAEMEKVRERMGDAVPYQFSYSGGEISPVYNAEGKLVNRFHNDTIVACIL